MTDCRFARLSLVDLAGSESWMYGFEDNLLCVKILMLDF